MTIAKQFVLYGKLKYKILIIDGINALLLTELLSSELLLSGLLSI